MHDSPDATPESGVASRFFDLWSRFYDIELIQRIAYRPVHDAVSADLKNRGLRQVIDIGCGTGLLTTRLDDELDASVCGLDYSRGMLDQARERSNSIPWIQGNSMTLPFADESFDAITCTESFHWYPDQPAALREFHRVLQHNGRALIAFMTSPVAALSRLTAPGTPLGRSAHHPTPSEVAAMVIDAGFAVEDQRRVSRIPGTPLLAATLTIAIRP